MAQIFNPLQENKRVVIIDVLRGWALLGVVLMNYADIFDFLGKAPHPGGFDKALIFTMQIVVRYKSVTMLAFLFGYGFAVLFDNLSSKKIAPVPFFARRMFWLLVIAIINSVFWFGDILKDYAVLGFLLIFTFNCSAKTIFYAALVLLLVNPFLVGFFGHNRSWFPMASKYFQLYQSHSVIDVLESGIMGTYYFEIANQYYLIVAHETLLICFMAGVAAQKINFFGRLNENKVFVKRIFWGSLVFTIVVRLFLGLVFSNPKYERSQLISIFKTYDLAFFPRLSSMAFIGSAICWLFLAGKLRRFFSSLQLYGRMTLTNYITQNIVAVLIFSGIGFNLAASGLSYGTYMLIGLSVYVAQIYLSKWWLSRYHYGPIEWLWRQLSYQKRLPLKIRTVETGNHQVNHGK